MYVCVCVCVNASEVCVSVCSRGMKFVGFKQKLVKLSNISYEYDGERMVN